ncbi:MAG: sugar ABC transporter permease [Gammaproteobacteria bacterium]
MTTLAQRLSYFSDRRFKYLLVWPAILILLLVGLFPLVYSLVVSFQNINLIDQDTSFQGWLNYKQLFQDSRLWWSLAHTLIFLAIALPLELIFGMLIALLCLERLPGKQIFIALLVLPTVISPLVAGATWRLMFDNRFGPINQILGWLFGEPLPIVWVVNPHFVYPAILIAEIWQWTPFMFLLLLAALANVDKSQMEAAEIDGASYWRIFFKIMLPAIKPVLWIAVLIRALDLFRLFDVVWALTSRRSGHAHRDRPIYAYVQGFQQFETSYTAAMAFLIIILLSIGLMLALKRMEIAR